MTGTFEVETMPKKPAPKPSDDRVTLLNLKGSEAERDWLQDFSRKTGMPISEIARRGVAMLAAKRGIKAPSDWVGE